MFCWIAAPRWGCWSSTSCLRRTTFLPHSSGLLGDGRDGTFRHGAEHQVQIKLKLKISGAFFSNDLGKEQFAWFISFVILYIKEMTAYAKTIPGRI